MNQLSPIPLDFWISSDRAEGGERASSIGSGRGDAGSGSRVFTWAKRKERTEGMDAGGITGGVWRNVGRRNDGKVG